MNATDSIGKILKEENIDQWDIYVEEAEEYEIQLRNFDVEVTRGPIKNSGYAVRIIKPKSNKAVGIGIGNGNSLEAGRVRKCLDTASVGADITHFPGYALPRPKKYPSVKIADPKIVTNAEAVVKDLTEELIALLKESKRVLPTFGKIRTYNVSTTIVNSEGLEAEKKETFIYIELALKAEREGKLAEYWPVISTRRAEDIHLDQQVPKWTKLAEDTLSAKVPKTAKTSVIFTPQILAEILPNTVGFHCFGSSVYRGVSKFKKDEKVATDELTVYDDGVRDYALGSSPFDDEGVPQSKTLLIERGIHKKFLYDAMYAAALSASLTGNGLKLPAFSLAFTHVDLKYSSLPSTQPTNIAVEAGDMSLSEMIADTKEGVYVEQFSGVSSDSLTTSFGSEIRNAYLVEKGQLSTPLKGGQISGFVLDSQRGKTDGLLNRVSGMTDEVQMAGRCVAPYMRFSGIQVAGK
jgi:PmbA protein